MAKQVEKKEVKKVEKAVDISKRRNDKKYNNCNGWWIDGVRILRKYATIEQLDEIDKRLNI